MQSPPPCASITPGLPSGGASAPGGSSGPFKHHLHGAIVCQSSELGGGWEGGPLPVSISVSLGLSSLRSTSPSWRQLLGSWKDPLRGGAGSPSCFSLGWLWQSDSSLGLVFPVPEIAAAWRFLWARSEVAVGERPGCVCVIPQFIETGNSGFVSAPWPMPPSVLERKGPLVQRLGPH